MAEPTGKTSITEMLFRVIGDKDTMNIAGDINSSSTLATATIAVLSAAIGAAVALAIWGIANVTPLPVTIPAGSPIPVTWPSALPVDISDSVTVNITNPLPITAPSPLPVSGTVSVSDFPSTYPVTGTFWQSTQPVSVASMPSTPVTGTFWQATQPVSGTVTSNTVKSATVSVTSVSVLLVAIQILASNASRLNAVCYNNSANSVYISTQAAASSSTNLFYILPTFTQVSLAQLMPGIMYTGALYAIRNSGSGGVVCTEFTL